VIRDYPDTPGLHLVDLDQEITGQRRFISCWVWRGEGPCYVVDPGPPATGDRLVAALAELGVRELDFILLTHIHLDHGGATARLLDRWPGARVVCHPRGRRHLEDPARLWEGSLAVLREKARVYGEPRPVPPAALAEDTEAIAAGLEIIPTPGHAPHHVCFRHGDRLFLGEAAGTFSTLGRGCDTDAPYLRPATPPMFKLEVAQGSLDRLLGLDPMPSRLQFAHHGRWCGDGAWLLRAARGQLGLWVMTLRDTAGRLGGLPAPGDDAAEERLFAATVEALPAADPWYARGAGLPGDIRAREADFTRQTLRGMLGYLRG
jgi:glyoxylase-like metal-dependent hydrolase (beta-lactamase superfamily II)